MMLVIPAFVPESEKRATEIVGNTNRCEKE
jgi:hypothetical protein